MWLLVGVCLELGLGYPVHGGGGVWHKALVVGSVTDALEGTRLHCAWYMRKDMVYYSENQGAKYATKAIMRQSASLTQNTNIMHLKIKVSDSSHCTQYDHLKNARPKSTVRKLTEPTPSVAWTYTLLGRKTVESPAIGPHRQTYALIRRIFHGSCGEAATHIVRAYQQGAARRHTNFHLCSGYWVSIRSLTNLPSPLWASCGGCHYHCTPTPTAECH